MLKWCTELWCSPRVRLLQKALLNHRAPPVVVPRNCHHTVQYCTSTTTTTFISATSLYSTVPCFLTSSATPAEALLNQEAPSLVVSRNRSTSRACRSQSPLAVPTNTREDRTLSACSSCVARRVVKGCSLDPMSWPALAFTARRTLRRHVAFFVSA